MFSILWAVWLLPNTVAIRHSAIAIGVILSLYIIYRNYRLLVDKNIIPILLIILLIIWITLHLFFIGREIELQQKEYYGVWRKITISLLFAVGLGLSLANLYNRTNELNFCWKIFYVGLTLPVVVYFVKLLLTKYSEYWGISSPYLLLDSNYQENSYGISRAIYSFYCIPSFATSICYLTLNEFKFNNKFDFLYAVSIILTPLLFFLESDRMGLLITLFITFTAAVFTLVTIFCNFNLKKLLVFSLVVIVLLFIGRGFTTKFPHLPVLLENAKISISINKQDSWKYAGTKAFPTNSYGQEPDRSTYERISWFVAGSNLLSKYPFGYGLLSLSFDKISKIEWPGSILSMTHSGFLDFALGYGFIGIALLLSSILISIYQGRNLPKPWFYFVISGYSSLLIVMLLKELSYEITIHALIFLIVLLSTFSCGVNSLKIVNTKNAKLKV